MENKPNIGIVPLWDEYNQRIWTQHGYTDCIVRAGGLPVILPLTEDERVFSQSIGMCDGFLLTGGPEVSSAIYDGKIRSHGIITCPEYIASRIINDLSGSAAVIDIHASNIFLEEIPQVRINELSRDTLVPLAYMLNSQTLTVNDCPHQEIKDLSPILRRMAYAEDGAIEAVYMPLKRFIWAVQWHPELSSQTDKANAKIFEAFIMYAKLCRN